MKLTDIAKISWPYTIDMPSTGSLLIGKLFNDDVERSFLATYPEQGVESDKEFMRIFVQAVARKGEGDDLWEAYNGGTSLNDDDVDGISDEDLESIARIYINSGVAYLLPYLPTKRSVDKDGNTVVQRVKDAQAGVALDGETACADLHRLFDSYFNRIKNDNEIKVRRLRTFDFRRRLDRTLLGVDIRSKEYGTRLTLWEDVEEPHSLTMRSMSDILGVTAAAQRGAVSVFQVDQMDRRCGGLFDPLYGRASVHAQDHNASLYSASGADLRFDRETLGLANSLVRQAHEPDYARLYGESPGAYASYRHDMVEGAAKAAQLMQRLALPSILENHRATADYMASSLIGTDRSWWQSQEHLAAFNQASAFAHLTRLSGRVDYEQISAIRALASAAIPHFESLGSYRNFLDSAGLHLPHWPRVRLLSISEKRQRFRERLRGARESTHVRAAKSLVHKYEIVLRDIIDVSMASEYGEDWAEDRLSACGCKGLLGKWKKRGGFLLEHADYAHYRDIMTHPEHFEAIFSAGFSDTDELRELIDKAGNLRAASHHAREFTKEDLRDLRLVWTSLEKGLLALTPDQDIDYY